MPTPPPPAVTHPAPPPPTQAQREALQRPPAQRVVMRQQWASLAFFHWRVDPDIIAARLPAGLYVDDWDGAAWLGVVPFSMRRVRPAGLPPLPWLSWFHELNVRTYVYDRHGRAGVWFFSLDCNQPVAVTLARWFFHLPYEHAAMRATRAADGTLSYHCRRKTETAADATCRYPVTGRPGRPPGVESPCQPAAPGTLEWFLAERYLLFAADPRGHILTGRVHHQPYRLGQLDPTVHPGTTLPLRWDGFAEPAEPPASALIADPVDVRIFPLTAENR